MTMREKLPDKVRRDGSTKAAGELHHYGARTEVIAEGRRLIYIDGVFSGSEAIEEPDEGGGA